MKTLPNIHVLLLPNYKFFSCLKNGMKQLLDPKRSLKVNPSMYISSVGILKVNTLSVPFTESDIFTLKS